jgi:hypothetical protein
MQRREETFWIAQAKRGGHGFRAFEGGAEAIALQTLRADGCVRLLRKRLECGAFTAAFARTRRERVIESFQSRESDMSRMPHGLCVLGSLRLCVKN